MVNNFYQQVLLMQLLQSTPETENLSRDEIDITGLNQLIRRDRS
jgi:hypothetical protein